MNPLADIVRHCYELADRWAAGWEQELVFYVPESSLTNGRVAEVLLGHVYPLIKWSEINISVGPGQTRVDGGLLF